MRRAKKLVDDLLRDKEIQLVYGAPFDPLQYEDAADYFDLVKKPMDLGTIRRRLKTYSYKTSDEVFADIRLVFENIRTVAEAQNIISLVDFAANHLAQIETIASSTPKPKSARADPTAPQFAGTAAGTSAQQPIMLDASTSLLPVFGFSSLFAHIHVLSIKVFAVIWLPGLYPAFSPRRLRTVSYSHALACRTDQIQSRSFSSARNPSGDQTRGFEPCTIRSEDAAVAFVAHPAPIVDSRCVYAQ